MNIDLPESLVQILESMDRNARAYGWNVATYGKLEDIVPHYAENPFNDSKWREKLGWTRVYPTMHYADEREWQDYIYGGVKNGVLIITTDVITIDLAEKFVQVFLQNYQDATEDFVFRTFTHDGEKSIGIALKKDTVPDTTVENGPEQVKSCVKVLDNEVHPAHEWRIFDTMTQEHTSYWCDGSQVMDSGTVVYLDIDEKQKHVLYQDALNELIGDAPEVGFSFTEIKGLTTSYNRVFFTPKKDDLVQAVNARHIYSCAECPYGTHLDPPEQWENNPTEAYFSCSLGLGENPERQWGETPPCEDNHGDGYYKRILSVVGLDINKYLEEGNDGPKIDVNDV